MIISENWLREWVDFDIDIESLGDRLTGAGLEVGGVIPVRPVSQRIVVAKILSARPHADGNTPWVCEIDVGRARKLQVVCGANNVWAGMAAPVALSGAELPGGQRVREIEIHGEASQGMLCSAAELGLEERSDGIMELDPGAEAGRIINTQLDLDDTLLELELTPNRGDCLSILGIARETMAVTQGVLRKPSIRRPRAQHDERLPITLEVPGDCPRYTGQIIRNVAISARSPDWLQERLRRSGLRNIDALVDITNYVMLELGQPMHAFDRSKITGGITVRHAHKGERLKLLDGTRLRLRSKTLLIADESGPVALAGIMGGANTAINSNTQDVLLEAAFFNPSRTASTARGYSMQTDASFRFERGVDPQLQVMAVQRASQLISQIGGGDCGPVFTAADPRNLPKRRPIQLRRGRLDRVLGARVGGRRIRKVFESLNMKTEVIADGWKITAPSYRFDIVGEHDLVEEVARIVGFEFFPAQLPRVLASGREQQENRLTPDRTRDLLVDRGYHEAITYSFVDPALHARIVPERGQILLQNPIASNMSQMRSSLWPGLLVALTGNARRQVRRIRLFEIGRVFLRHGRGRREADRIAGVLTGPRRAQSWDTPSRGADYFDLKGDVEGLLALGGCQDGFEFQAREHKALHPGQCARVVRSEREVGWLGQISPELREHLDLDGAIFVFELDLDAVLDAILPSFRTVSRYPAVARDLSLVVKKSVSADALRNCICAAAGDLLTTLELLDVYQGKGVPKNHSSLTYRLTLQADYRNLTDTEVDELIVKVVSAVTRELSGELRT